MLNALVLFMVALPVLAAAVSPAPHNPEIRRVLKACARERARLNDVEG